MHELRRDFMAQMLIDNSINDFSAALASNSPTPGGGGAAALAGALGIALCNMAGAISASPKREGLYAINDKASELRMKLLALVDEDAKNFEPLSKAYSKPKTDPDYAETMRSATLNACTSPMEMMRACCEAVELLEQTKALCSKLLLSDVACGAELCKAGLKCASFNVFVNTKMLSAEDANPIEAEADMMLNEYVPRAEKISEDIMNSLRGRE